MGRINSNNEVRITPIESVGARSESKERLIQSFMSSSELHRPAMFMVKWSELISWQQNLVIILIIFKQFRLLTATASNGVTHKVLVISTASWSAIKIQGAIMSK